jgi:hypothetical protein
MGEAAAMTEYLWPPSSTSVPALVAMAVGMATLVWYLFMTGGESE